MRILPLALIAMTFLSACETIKGAGRDVTAAGNTLDRAID